MHVHYLPHLSLSYARHTNALNQTFILLSDDYSKSLHLQTDRFLEFHTPSGLHYTTRIPRYGRDLKYNTRTTEALVPSVGVNGDGYGEVFRLNLEVGRFMRGFEVDVGGDDFNSLGGGALQGGIGAGSVHCAAVAEESHGLMAFGTSLGTVEFWDARRRNRVSVLGPPTSASILDTGQDNLRPEVTAVEFHTSGLNLATGSSNGLIHTYDLRSPVPLLRKDQGYGFPIQTLKYLTPRSSSSSSSISPDKLLTSDRKSIKIFDSPPSSGELWTSIEPAVDLNHVAWVPDSGMLLTANEGRQQHSFFIPQLGPAPKWCSFLDNLVEEMADDTSADPNAYTSTSGTKVGEVYDNYKFLSQPELRALNLDHLVGGGGTTNVLRPYMHGYFVPQRLYEQARLMANPDLMLEQRQRSIREKIDKERESRIRGNKKINVKVNRKLAEKLVARDEANERRKAVRLLRKQGGQDFGGREEDVGAVDEVGEVERAKEGLQKKARMDLMDDERFRGLFEDEDFEIDEGSREYQLHNPSSAGPGASGELKKRGLTAVEEEDLEDERRGSSDEDEDQDEDEDVDDEEAELGVLRQRQRSGRVDDEDAEATKGRIGSASYKKSGHRSQWQRGSKDQQKASPRMQVTSSSKPRHIAEPARQSKSFGDLASSLSTRERGGGTMRERGSGVVGGKEMSFTPAKGVKKRPQAGGDGVVRGVRGVKGWSGGGGGKGSGNGKERRSASGNVFRRM